MTELSKVAWNPYSPGYFDNPYPHLKQCREQNPVQQIFKNSWLFLNYKEVDSVLSNKNHQISNLSLFFKEKEAYIFKGSSACPYLSKSTKMWPMYLNGSDHKNVRSIMGKSLNAKGLDSTLQESVLLINHKYSKSTNFDLVEYCSEYVYLIIKEILGIDNFEELQKVRTYSNMLARSQDLYIPKQVYLEINDWFLWGKGIFSASTFKENLERLSKDLDLKYSEEDIYSIISLALMASFETSKDNLTLALYEILQKQELIDYILECDIQALNTIIEEIFRFTNPLQYTIRVNNEAIELYDQKIPANSNLYLCLASANRDETVFENPDEIVINRKNNPHLSFGKGSHFCLGAAIARREMYFCLKPMVYFLKKYSFKKQPNVRWSKQIFMRTIESLELELKK